MLTQEMQAKGAEKPHFMPHFMRGLEPLNGLVWGINIPTIYKYIYIVYRTYITVSYMGIMDRSERG